MHLLAAVLATPRAQGAGKAEMKVLARRVVRTITAAAVLESPMSHHTLCRASRFRDRLGALPQLLLFPPSYDQACVMRPWYHFT